MVREKILVIEDEEDILAVIQYNLAKEGYQVSFSTSGEEGLRLAFQEHPDLIVLDLMLPGMNGLEVCRRLQQDAQGAKIPVIMLTAKSEDEDVVTGLEAGATDYVTKPFSFKVLLARVKAALRRSSEAQGAAVQEETIEVSELVIHPGRNEVFAAGTAVELTFTEFRILRLLATRPGWVYSRSQIMDAVRGEDYAVTERAVDVQIAGLRKKLGPCGGYIETVRGVGYRFKG